MPAAWRAISVEEGGWSADIPSEGARAAWPPLPRVAKQRSSSPPKYRTSAAESRSLKKLRETRSAMSMLKSPSGSPLLPPQGLCSGRGRELPRSAKNRPRGLRAGASVYERRARHGNEFSHNGKIRSTHPANFNRASMVRTEIGKWTRQLISCRRSAGSWHGTCLQTKSIIQFCTMIWRTQLPRAGRVALVRTRTGQPIGWPVRFDTSAHRASPSERLERAS